MKKKSASKTVETVSKGIFENGKSELSTNDDGGVCHSTCTANNVCWCRDICSGCKEKCPCPK